MTLEILLGGALRDLPPLFTEEKAISFDPVQMMLLQKLVRPSALSASISVAKEDFFAAIIYLDTFAEILAARPTLLEDAGVIADELERRHAYLDPDLELLVRYSLVHVERDLGGERFFRKAIAKQILKRHELANTLPTDSPSGTIALDPFYAALGRMAASLFETERVRSSLHTYSLAPEPPRLHSGARSLGGTLALGRNDLRLAVVADGLLRILSQGTPSEGRFTEGASWETASWPDRVCALLAEAFAREGTRSLAEHIDTLQRKLEGSRP